MNFLFICRSNAGRSQMASAFFKRCAQGHMSSSAGIEVGEKEGIPLPAFVLECMSEIGYDLSGERRKQLTQEIARDVDKIVAMVEKEDLPDYIRNSKKLIWFDVQDARGQSYEFHIKIRDQIRDIIEKLVREI